MSKFRPPSYRSSRDPASQRRCDVITPLSFIISIDQSLANKLRFYEHQLGIKKYFYFEELRYEYKVSYDLCVRRQLVSVANRQQIDNFGSQLFCKAQSTPSKRTSEIESHVSDSAYPYIHSTNLLTLIGIERYFNARYFLNAL